MRTPLGRTLLALLLVWLLVAAPAPAAALYAAPVNQPTSIPAARAVTGEGAVPQAAPVAEIQIVLPLTYTVNSTGDEPDAVYGDGICATALGTCTLRAAIETVNARTPAEPDKIIFAIGGAAPGWRIISITDTLPIIFKPLTISGPNMVGGVIADLILSGNEMVDEDGAYTQHGLRIGSDHVRISNIEVVDFPDAGIRIESSSYVTITGSYIGKGGIFTPGRGNATGISLGAADHCQIGGSTAGKRNVIAGNRSRGVDLYNSDYITIENNYIGLLDDGTTASGNEHGVFIEGSHNRVLNNVISGNTLDGVHIQKKSYDQSPSTYNVIAGNKIGTDASGTLARPNSVGIKLVTGSDYTVIGGDTAGERNLISGNTYSGIDIPTGDTLGVQIIGNYIGTNVMGTAALPNRDGITVANGQAVTIGGASPNEGNLISGNTNRGIYLHTGGHTVSFNKIGTNAAGSAPLGNGGHGIELNSVPGYIGRSAPSISSPGDNIIAFNGGAGIALALHAPANIYGNRIYANGGLGIDYGKDGPTPNSTAGSAPSMTDPVPANYPILTGVVVAGSTVTITGYIDTASSITATIQIYVSDSADPSGCGEGQDWVGVIPVLTDSAGHAEFSAAFSGAVVRVGHYAATAWTLAARTGEFSCVNVIDYKVHVPLVQK